MISLEIEIILSSLFIFDTMANSFGSVYYITICWLVLCYMTPVVGENIYGVPAHENGIFGTSVILW